MGKITMRTIIICLDVLLALMVSSAVKLVLFPPIVHAVAGLSIDMHVPAGNPIFVVTNMLPGDTEVRSVDVTNTGTVPRYLWVKGTRTGPPGEVSPKLETALDIVIREGANVLYGPKKLTDFFADSTQPQGVGLSILAPGAHTTYTFTVTFPSESTNEFKQKSVIFDLAFGVKTAKNLVINEVYYQVDGAHGWDSPKDRGVHLSAVGNNDGVIIDTKIGNTCLIVNNGNTIVQNVGSSSATGNASVNINILNLVNVTVVSCNCSQCNRKNDEWIELYNPTDYGIPLKNWRIRDNSGTETIIRANRTIPSGGFALLAKDAATWRFWNENPRALKIELGQEIGDGLDNRGDHLLLKKPDGSVADALGWGADTAVWSPAVPLVSLGASLERKTPGWDTDQIADWQEQNPPTPGW